MLRIRRVSLVALACLAALPIPAAAAAQTEETPPGTPSTTVPAPPPSVPPPPPFSMPMDSGPKLIAARDRARLEIVAGEPALASAEVHRDELHAEYDRLTARLNELEGDRRQKLEKIADSRERLNQSAADAYVHASADSATVLSIVAKAQEALDLRRDLHLIETYGESEIEIHDRLVDEKQELDGQIDQVGSERDDVKADWDAATRHADELRVALEDARRRLQEAEAGIERFHRLASTAGSPILGPNRLTAQQLADFVRASGNTPNITVTIDELAQLYIDESEKVGVRGDVAWAQSILETGYFGFAGSMVEPEDNNFAGIGACDSCTRGFQFEDARHGVRAQMQLLRTYTDASLTEDTLPDPLLLPGTLRLGFRGRVKSWWDLTGTWATAIDYGIRVYALYDTMVKSSPPAAPG